ncbi:hypothetical protein [Microvirga thermotolerans]|uniref:Uncharacterized protein n=1 Tax=Microvirga thermotolerans TaxID=2651334 RepID=A0A5P9JYP4_9HYPH|nr:hypothetical protein [Microvirga thermotolerans]QFU17261.1 hypothetical protein GDR74_14095 [Microvirga thermotolerans]
MPNPSGRLSRASRRLLNPVLLAVAVVVVLVDDAFRAFVIPAVRALARLPVVQWIERAVGRLPPYGILTLFLVPLAVIEPFKLYALYLFGQGHFASGLLTFFVAKVVGLGLAERLFAIGRDKLLTIGWFAWCFAKTIAVRDLVHAWLEGTWAWRQAKRVVRAVRAALAQAGRALGRLLRAGGGRGRLAAALRRVRQRPAP